MNDDLRDRLRRLDPMHPDVPVEPPTTPSSRIRLEQIMNTPLIEDGTAAGEPSPRPHRSGRPPRFGAFGRPGLIAAGLAAAAVVAVAGAAVVGQFGDGGADDAAPPLELSLGDSTVMASCLPFDTDLLGTMSPAFAATATEVGDGTVTLDVDKWYAGGDAETVMLAAQPGMQALIDGFDFVAGQQYLITAAQGTVNFCGFSGPATPELTAAFETAFGG